MKLIFCNRSNWNITLGGDSIQMLKTKEALEKKYNLSITIAKDFQDIQKTDAQIVHIFNIQTIDDSLLFAHEAKKYNKKIVLSPIYWDFSHSNFVEILGHFNIFNIHKRMYVYFKKIMDILLHFCSILFKKPILYSKTFREKVVELIELSDIILPNSIEEIILFQKFFKLQNINYKIVYNAIDPTIFKINDRIKAPAMTKKVICVGRISPTKNQLGVLYALYDLREVEITFVGDISNIPYYEKILKISQKRGNVKLITYTISQEELSKLYYQSDVHVLPSFRESPGLSSLESLYSGLNIVVSSEEFCPINTYFKNKIGKNVFICDPYNINSIKKAVLEALTTNEHNIDNDLIFSWDITAEKTFESYKSLRSTK